MTFHTKGYNNENEIPPFALTACSVDSSADLVLLGVDSVVPVDDLLGFSVWLNSRAAPAGGETRKNR